MKGRAAIIPLLAGVAWCQTAISAPGIYQSVSPSVLLLYSRSGGEYRSQGTGFVIADGRIVTNAHVADGGTVYVQLGPARIPATVLREDTANDLALLSVSGDLGAPSLALAKSAPMPGETIFVVGNPEGLARSISSGIVAASRSESGRHLLQITAPISHGSSGSPVVNVHGEVVGIVSSTLAEGQNLNFAVPVTVLRDLLAGGRPASFETLLARAEGIHDQISKLSYSAAPDSEYQRMQNQMVEIFTQAFAQTNGDAGRLHRLYTSWPEEQVARAEVTARPDTVAYLDLAYALESESFSSNSTQKLQDALSAANSSIEALKDPAPEPYIEKGEILNESNVFGEAESSFIKALAIAPAMNSDLMYRVLRGLSAADFGLGRFAESGAWFDKLVQTGRVAPWDWSAQGERLSKENDHAGAALAYQNAAGDPADFSSSQDWNRAALNFAMSDQLDPELAAARKCIETAPHDEGGKSAAESCHYLIAVVLNTRGVYAAALNDAAAAVALDPSDGWAYDAEAEALDGLRRYSEAAKAEQTAISLTDGKFAGMQFQLGSIYFDEADWEDASDAYRRSAEMNTADSAAAYNTALCESKLDQYGDALHWYREALQRDPNTEKRDTINQQISLLEKLLGGG